MRTPLALALAAVVLAGAAVTAAAQTPEPRKVSARAWVALDADTGRVLLAQRAHERRPIASLTKMMTGLLVAEAGALGGRVTVPLAATLVRADQRGAAPWGALPAA